MSTMARTHVIEIQGPPRIAAGVATILLPVLLTAGFALHPHLFTPRMTTTATELAAKFHGQAAFHVGHTIVLAAVPFIIVMFMSVMAALGGRGKRLGNIGGVLLCAAYIPLGVRFLQRTYLWGCAECPRSQEVSIASRQA